jgi:hypothetical protein
MAGDRGLGNKKQKGLRGIITARQCPECGHHEMGFTTQDGVFHPLRPGTIIRTEDPSGPPGTGEEARHDMTVVQRGIPESLPRVPWLPDPLWGNRTMRLKYGVLLETTDPGIKVTQEIYWKGYMEKLLYLISKEQATPLPVILDRMFTAPHLATGEPQDIAERLWENLEEVRRPVRQVGTWMERGDEESVRKMIHPIKMEALEKGDRDRELLQKELAALSLEDFLEVL